ncbi:MAG: DUF547 domain-containing protein [Planctomycetes bacterium]|nr:DUF547 domain-containing protein [Planctomycetota bacterium]
MFGQGLFEELLRVNADMIRKSISNLFVALLVFAASQIITTQVFGAEPDNISFDYKDYAKVLKSYVNDTGMVDYRKLKAKPKELNAFVTAIAKLDPKRVAKWSEKEKIAFWLNAYNSLTLKVIIDNYPIKSSFFKSRVYPKNSIRQISGVWTKKKFMVMGKKLTIGHIEHEILRKNFKEPAIHMAMVCAAMSCPPLRNEPYSAEKLDLQLADQSKKFLSDPKKFKVGNNTLHLSPILKWFAKDFLKTDDKGKDSFAGYKGEKAAVLRFIVKHLKEDDKKWLNYKQRQKIKYLKYDWSLNEQHKKTKR